MSTVKQRRAVAELEALEIVADACRSFLDARRKRAATYQWATQNEAMAVWAIRDSLRRLDERSATPSRV